MRISDWSSDVCSSDLQQVAEFLGGQPVDADGLGLQLADLAHRLRGGPGEPRFLGFHLAGGDAVLDDLEIAGLAHIGRPDRHARPHDEPLEHKPLPGLIILPHRLPKPYPPTVSPTGPTTV